jgi:serine/threonine-protein kinase
MAPEQIRGEAIDGRTDLFAVGIVLYELLTGAPPWPEGEGRNVALDVLRAPPPPLAERCPSAPEALVAIVERCLEKAPERRWSSAHALRQALEALVHARVPVDPRGRLVLDLEARGFVTPEEARRLVPPEQRAPGRGQPPRAPDPARVLRPIAVAHAVGLAVIVAAAVLTGSAPVGAPLPEARPRLGPVMEMPPDEAR